MKTIMQKLKHLRFVSDANYLLLIKLFTPRF